MTSGPQVSRLLTLMPYLRRWDGIDVATAAAEFGVTPAQLLKDLQVLVMCGLPGGGPNDLIEINLDVAREEGYIHVANTPDLRPLRFSRDEAMSLIVAVEAVRQAADPAAAAVAQRVIDKLSRLVGDSPPIRLTVDAGEDEVRGAITSAIEAGRRLRLTYDGAARRETTFPVVDPACIEVRDGVSYLLAWSLERAAWRHYRLDRIAAIDVTDEAAAAHVPPRASRWFAGNLSVVTLDLDAQAAWVAEYYPARRTEPLPGGGVRVTVPVADRGWLMGLILRLGPHVLAVGPAGAAKPALAAAAAAIGQDSIE